mgnify:CR=1 FL=1
MRYATELNEALLGEEDHVRAHSGAAANRKIDRAAEENIRYWSTQPREEIDAPNTALDRKWDVERHLETASSHALTGVIAGFAGRRTALVFPASCSRSFFNTRCKGGVLRSP